MKKHYILIFFLIGISSFILGALVGYYEALPFDTLKNSSQVDNSHANILDKISDDDINELIQIQDNNDIKLKKLNLVNYIWKTNTLPSNLPDNVEKNFSDLRFENMENLNRIEKIEVSMNYLTCKNFCVGHKFSLNSNPYLFMPEKSNNKLIIYHQGHAGSFVLGKDTISHFLNEGYSVLAFSMPLVSENNQPIVDTKRFGKIKLTHHDDFELLETSDSQSPIKFFVEPIIVALNHVDKNYNFESYYMVGISGGGWTTTLVAALDDRISKSYSVAGSFPFFLRNDIRDLGDYEQRVVPLYRIANYLELYTMASFGEERMHIQIFNKFDRCCFAGESPLIYYDSVDLKLSELVGTFEIWIDDTHKEHKISQHTRNLILSSME